ncbi:AAL140Cp [Eremothecium gossypii ATCC 10895]|uniref:AAL140Cp n=1 Tax=Eremothecium gossypii (strain ATCC 10895 / CBS 109.51 / FGSC 9923 / NRRL Y-1056) TaxID=284811 RepID=Q75F68_EREGS|nr:AAL140Cp [Eremothecium gossypii ATCC 10895]AAS50226.1 AAL140Cp [Eremothecium gossypii ATCC 10895]AEY94511.1 FAAL140Cp [Eremothecium gossypii FDAG1]
MSTYIRGPVCGTDNCRSRLWRIINGHRTCQYGHVMEGDVEFNDDDEEFSAMGVVTRRLNLTTNATGNFQSSQAFSQTQVLAQHEDEKRLLGAPARELFLKCFQYILRKQCSWLIEEQGFPIEFSKTVKIIWMLYLKHMEPETPPAGDDANETVSAPSQTLTERYRTANGGRMGLSMLSTLAFHYLACVHLGLPAHTDDFIRWVSSLEMPYFRAVECLPAEWQKKLPNYYTQIMEGSSVPRNAQLHHKISSVALQVKFSAHFQDAIPAGPMILKLVTLTGLPPEFYLYTTTLLELIEHHSYVSVLAHDSTHVARPHLYPELRIAALFITSVDWVLQQQDYYNIEYLLAWLRRENAVRLTQDTASRNRELAHLAQQPTQLPVAWSQEQASAYLDWLESDFLPKYDHFTNSHIPLDHKIARRKLYNILPLAPAAKLEPTHPSSRTFINTLQEFYFTTASSLSTVSESPAAATRSAAVAKVRHKLVRDLAAEFGVSSQQLTNAVNTIQKQCLVAVRRQAT